MVSSALRKNWQGVLRAFRRFAARKPPKRHNKGKDRQFVLYRLRVVEIVLIGLASVCGIYFAYRQIEINRDMVDIQKNQVALQQAQLDLQQSIEQQHREELIAKYMGALETGTLSEQLGAAYALSRIEGDETIGALSRGLISNFEPVGETTYSHIVRHAGNYVKPVDMETYIHEYQEKTAKLKENPALRPRTPIRFDKAVDLALDLIAQNPAKENSTDKPKFTPWSFTVPLSKRATVVERAIRLLRKLPGNVLTTTGDGYGPTATLHAFLPAESNWSSCSALAIEVTTLLIKSGYIEQGPEFHRYDIVRAEAVRLLHQFRHAQSLTEDGEAEKSRHEPQIIWAMGQFIATSNLRTTNFMLYKGGQVFYGYRVPAPINENEALSSLDERLRDFLWFAGSSNTARASAILALDGIRQAAEAQGLTKWWKAIWNELSATDNFKNLQGQIDEFHLSWEWTLITATQARSRAFTVEEIQKAKDRLFMSK